MLHSYGLHRISHVYFAKSSHVLSLVGKYFAIICVFIYHRVSSRYRKIYETRKIQDFPVELRDAVQRNYKGQLFMDFYRCVVQDEKLEDFTSTLMTLKKLCHSKLSTNLAILFLYCRERSRQGFKTTKSGFSQIPRFPFGWFVNDTIRFLKLPIQV